MGGLHLDGENKPVLGGSLETDPPSRYAPAPRGWSEGTQAALPCAPRAPTLSLAPQSCRMLPTISFSTQASSCSLGAHRAMLL